MRTHIQIPEIHPANVSGRSKQGALKCPIVPGFVPISRHRTPNVNWKGSLWTEASPLAQAGECRDGPSLQLLQFLDKLLAGQRPLKTPATIQAASDCIGSDLQPPPP